ncbi:cytochrome c3 family protein [Opitutus terrae]|uniref:Cytochrome c family protein n=1 Tax=Opitutus terrae (strain DSM 11246 / JCM 15787 / PB90-1) TaxID=452637 RepID=B1ZZD7_OPITP|nr:cytochrome c3 family protein [Opitutus terrae]ACB77209.1 cytochrome c family protein [Opitutus terrae PB90-1]
MSSLFPKSANRLPLQIVIYLVVLGGIATAGVTYYMTPKYTRVGYAPVQPVPFSHNLHAGQLGLDCRYCHTGVDKGRTSVVPTAQTCMNCHNQVKPDSPLLAVVKQSYETGDPVPWVKVHEVPDFVFFNHSAHVNRGVSCVECHGKVNTMDVVTHEQPLSMSFCLECHRNPATRVRAPQDVYNLDSLPIAAQAGTAAGEKFVHDWKIKPPQSCTGCHR